VSSENERCADLPVTVPAGPSGFKTFSVIWFGQLVSAMGSSLGSFALGLWVFERHRSVTQLSLLAFTGGLAALLFGPYAGVIADRYDRRRLLIGCNLASAAATLVIASLLYAGRLEPWHAYPINAVMTILGILSGPTFFATITLLVPPRHLARASGMAQLSGGAAQLVGPLLAAGLLGVIGFSGLILLDFATFLFAVGTLLAVRIPGVAQASAAVKRTVLRESIEAWRYLRARPGMLSLLGLFSLTNFAIGMVQILLTPLILSFAKPIDLGKVSSAGAAGVLLGGLTLSLWGGPRRRVWGIFVALFAQGLILLLGGLRPSVPLVAWAAFVFMLGGPFIYGCSQAIWQSKVAPALQGRVFAMRQVVASCSMPVAFLLAGPLADRVFEPLLVPGGLLAASVGRVIGVGPGRGIGLLFMILGLGIVLVTFLSLMSPRLRHVEQELPDVVAMEEERRESGPERRVSGLPLTSDATEI
jgi:DHA3 family macrolide efflux protein-like MFS transporter